MCVKKGPLKICVGEFSYERWPTQEKSQFVRAEEMRKGGKEYR